MQPIPRPWATLRETHTFPGTGTFALTIHGWSDQSVQEAERDARARMERLVAAGGPTQHGTSGHEYYPERRLPEELLEEIHGEDGALIAAITRNRYGTAVLNTDALLISDIDLPEPSRRSRAGTRPGLLARLFGGRTSDGRDARAHEAEVQGADGGRAGGGPDVEDPAATRVLETIRAFTADHPDLGVRTYRTRGGFRLLIAGAHAGPSSDRARQLMEQLRSDQLYMLLCRVHDSYRARLTPKPWRISVDRFEQLGTRTAADAVHRDWVERYRVASREFAVCRLLDVAGPAPSAVELQLIDLHDRATRTDSALPLA